MIQTGKEQGCTIKCGGAPVEGTDGYFIQPTVLTDLRDDMEISQKEVRGFVTLVTHWSLEYFENFLMQTVSG